VGRVDEYRRNATECLKMATALQSPEARRVLLHMAQAWLRLADRSTLPRSGAEGDTGQFDP
jgi:hypothetical protein